MWSIDIGLFAAVFEEGLKKEFRDGYDSCKCVFDDGHEKSWWICSIEHALIVMLIRYKISAGDDWCFEDCIVFSLPEESIW